MTCVSPPELSDGELLADFDGKADHKVTAHLRRCPHCRERARQLAQFQNLLTAHLYRITCPSTKELGEYHLGIMPDDQAKATTHHLAKCPHCTREVAQLKDFLADLEQDLEPGPLEQIKRQIKVLIARLVSGGPEGGPLNMQILAPAGAGIRGEEKGPYRYQAEDVQVAIEVQDDVEQVGRKAILGLVLGAEPAGLEAHLWQAEQRVVVIPVNELGNFIIPDLAPGNYELILSGPEIEIHIQELQIGTH